MSVLKKGLTAAVAAATLGTIATPAEARHRYYRHRDNDGAWAIGAGIVGLGIAAAIASSHRGRYYDPYYGGGYYGGHGYGYGHNYGYYDRGYYDRGYYGRCYTRRVYDPYIGRRVRVRYCG